MTTHRFEGMTASEDDLPDRYYLNAVHSLIRIGELTPSEEATGRLSIRRHDLHIVTPEAGQFYTEKITPTLYLGTVALQE